ncbi:MAG TPA: aconitate hydratase [Exilispira sp.]|nr:aconitate hydratase [Exilispira sp.]
MGESLARKILKAHLVEGELVKGKEIAIKIDQTLTQDATGTMAYLQFESIGIDKIRTELSVSYIDHNTLQTDFMNADDHQYLMSVAKKYGIHFSRPGNGICHQVHLERFAKPGKTLLGSDSHTPTAGGMGMIAIGAGGLDVAVAMAGGAFYLEMPSIVKVKLTGKLQPFVSAKDIILELLRRLTVKGGVNKIFEYCGDGVKTLTVPERATITNMGAELGATCSIFPSDEITKQFLKAQGREQDFVEMKADDDATYDEEIEIDLSTLEPMVAKPHMPDQVVKISEIEGLPIDQVAIGSCTNSSLKDILAVASIVDGKTVAENVEAALAPGSKNVILDAIKLGALEKITNAGFRLLESACGPCIGMGFAPNSKGRTLRTFNRNFKGRSGTDDAEVYLVSPEVAAYSAIMGKISDPRKAKDVKFYSLPEKYTVTENLIIKPLSDEERKKVEIIRGPNIKPCPSNTALPDSITAKVLLKTGDNITTDDIMPAGAKILPLRSNVPEISKYVFERVDPDFYKRAKEEGIGFIVGGDNYGQGSSREHAALAPMYLGIKAVIAKKFARIHKANLINFGIVPLVFDNPSDYDTISQGDILEMNNIKNELDTGYVTAINKTKNLTYKLKVDTSGRFINILKAGGLLNYVR